MPQKYVRKTTRQSWNGLSMINALKAVEDGMPYKTASKKFTVPIMALKRRAKGKNVYAVGGAKVLGSKRQVFSQEQELELCRHVKDMESRMFEFTTKDVLSLAYQLAEKNKIKHPFSADTGKAGMDWFRGFRKRHPDITVRAPKSTSANRKIDKTSSGISSGDTNCPASGESQVKCEEVIIKEEVWCQDLEMDNNLLEVYKEEYYIDESADSGAQSSVSCDSKKNIYDMSQLDNSVGSSFKCEQCDKQFHLKCRLTSHMLTHTSDKPFECSLCNIKFKSKYSHNKHMMSHNAEGTYKCELCDKQYHWESYLRRHMLTHTSAKPFVCTLCNKEFKSKCNHNAHMKSHNVEGTYKCELCDKQFHWMCHLSRHMLMHTSDKPFTCTLCNKLYKTKNSYDKHMLSHCAEIYFKCEICHKKFKLRRGMLNHMRTHENEAAT